MNRAISEMKLEKTHTGFQILVKYIDLETYEVSDWMPLA